MRITDDKKQELLELKPEDLTFSKFVYLFGDTTTVGKGIKGESKSRFSTTDTMTLTPKEYFVKENTETTVGRFIYNKYIVEACGLQDILGYINVALSDSNNNKFVESKLSAALIEDDITNDQFVQYIDRRDNLGMTLNSVICTSFTKKSILPIKSVMKKKAELFKKHDKELKEGNIHVSEMIEKELVSMSKKELKGDAGMDLFDSEARGNFSSYKNMYLFKGATPNRQTGGYDILRSALIEGIRKEDIPPMGTAIVTGQYPKSIGTGESGYITKQLLASMQGEVLDEPNTDCGTKLGLKMKIEPGREKDFLYRYIIEGDKLVKLDYSNLNKYSGKIVNMRSIMYCKGVNGNRGRTICSRCGGELSYRLGNRNIGLATAKISGALLKMGMKKFHSSNLASKPIDIDDMMF